MKHIKYVVIIFSVFWISTGCATLRDTYFKANEPTISAETNFQLEGLAKKKIAILPSYSKVQSTYVTDMIDTLVQYKFSEYIPTFSVVYPEEIIAGIKKNKMEKEFKEISKYVDTIQVSRMLVSMPGFWGSGPLNLNADEDKGIQNAEPGMFKSIKTKFDADYTVIVILHNDTQFLWTQHAWALCIPAVYIDKYLSELKIFDILIYDNKTGINVCRKSNISVYPVYSASQKTPSSYKALSEIAEQVIITLKNKV